MENWGGAEMSTQDSGCSRNIQHEAVAYGSKDIITVDKYFSYSEAFPAYLFWSFSVSLSRVFRL